MDSLIIIQKQLLKSFKSLSGLVVDGILGPITKAALEKGEESYIAIGGADINNVKLLLIPKISKMHKNYLKI